MIKWATQHLKLLISESRQVRIIKTSKKKDVDRERYMEYLLISHVAANLESIHSNFAIINNINKCGHLR